MIRKLLVLCTSVALALGLSVAGATAANATGSDSPTPYTVSEAGITLPAGVTFKDGGHANIKTSVGDKGIHFESLNNQPSGQWIGKNALPWSAFELSGSFCVTWVQLSDYNEHFGEGGQAPICVGTPPTEEPEEPVFEVKEVCAIYTVDNFPENKTDWPQTRISKDCDFVPAVECGETIRYQFDKYWIRDAEDQAKYDSLEHLNSPADDASLEPHGYFVKTLTGEECKPGEANPAAALATDCGTATVTLTNDLGEEKERLTASFVIYVDGKFFEAHTVPAGETVTDSFGFPEDSGDHTVVVRTGPAFGDVELAKGTVETDCEPEVITFRPDVQFKDSCGISDDAYTPSPETEQYGYTVDDQRVDGVGTVKVEFFAKDGFVFEGGTPLSFSYEFKAEECEVPPTNPPVTPEQPENPVVEDSPTCDDLTYSEAQEALAEGATYLDADSDGVACDSTASANRSGGLAVTGAENVPLFGGIALALLLGGAVVLIVKARRTKATN